MGRVADGSIVDRSCAGFLGTFKVYTADLQGNFGELMYKIMYFY